MSRIDKSTEIVCQGLVADGGGWGETAKRYKISFWGDKNVLKLDCDNGGTTLNIPKKQ